MDSFSCGEELKNVRVYLYIPIVSTWNNLFVVADAVSLKVEAITVGLLEPENVLG